MIPNTLSYNTCSVQYTQHKGPIEWIKVFRFCIFLYSGKNIFWSLWIHYVLPLIFAVLVLHTCFPNNSQDPLLSSQLMFQADQICYAVLCVFSYMAAGQERQQQQPAAARRVGASANVHHHLSSSSSGAQSLGAGGLSPRGPGGGGLASLPRGPNFSEPSPRNIVGQT